MERNEEQKKIAEGVQKKIDYLEDWTARAKGVKDVTPHVQNVLASAYWERDALRSIPPGVAPPAGEIAAAINNDLAALPTFFPSPPEYDSILTATGNVVNTSGSLTILSYVAEIGKYGTSEAQEYSRKHTAQYQEMQQKQHHADEVRGLLEKLHDVGMLERFDKASTSYSRMKAGTAERTETGNEMRNLLQGLKGILWKMAQEKLQENMTWAIMAERLAIGGHLSVQCTTLKAQEKENKDLQESLSKAAKDFEGSSPIDLGLVWTKLIGHMYVVLGLVKLPNLWLK